MSSSLEEAREGDGITDRTEGEKKRDEGEVLKRWLDYGHLTTAR